MPTVAHLHFSTSTGFYDKDPPELLQMFPKATSNTHCQRLHSHPSAPFEPPTTEKRHTTVTEWKDKRLRDTNNGTPVLRACGTYPFTIHRQRIQRHIDKPSISKDILGHGSGRTNTALDFRCSEEVRHSMKLVSTTFAAIDPTG